MGMQPDGPAAKLLARAAGELSRIEYECLEVQDADNAASMANMSADDIRKRQMLDRVTQEIAALGEVIGALARTGDASQAVSAVGLTSMRVRLAGEPTSTASPGEPELF